MIAQSSPSLRFQLWFPLVDCRILNFPEKETANGIPTRDVVVGEVKFWSEMWSTRQGE